MPGRSRLARAFFSLAKDLPPPGIQEGSMRTTRVRPLRRAVAAARAAGGIPRRERASAQVNVMGRAVVLHGRQRTARCERVLSLLGRSRRLLSGLAALLLATSCSTTQAVRTPAPPEISASPQAPSEGTGKCDPSLSLPLSAIPEPEPSSTVAQPDSARRPPGILTLLKKDAKHFATAPLHWGRSDWTKLGIGMLAVGGIILLDDELLQSVERNSNGTTRRIADTVEPLGSEYSWGVLGAFFLTGKYLNDGKARAVAEDGLASSLIAAGVITPILKAAIGRQRPSQTGETFALGNGGMSFPSGHATQAFAVASVIASHYDSPWVRVAAYGLAGLVGWSRMENNAHYASDVLAGALIGTVVGRTVVRLHKNERLRIAVAPPVNPRTVGVALTVRTDLGDAIGFFKDD